MTGLAIRPLRLDDVKAAGALLAASHGEYPAFRTLIADPAVRRRMLLPFQTAAVRDAVRNGHTYGAFIAGGLVGVALWQPPGRFPLSKTRKLRMAPALLRSAAVAPRAFPRFARSGAALEREFPAEPVWYLQALGVHPDLQRRGSGAALLAAGLVRVDADRVACYLHTSDHANLEYYRRQGFELTQPGFPAGSGGPTYYGMTRPPASRRNGMTAAPKIR
jgi:ribosomal protein S18 acetylase RimI-like enzyme